MAIWFMFSDRNDCCSSTNQDLLILSFCFLPCRWDQRPSFLHFQARSNSLPPPAYGTDTRPSYMKNNYNYHVFVWAVNLFPVSCTYFGLGHHLNVLEVVKRVISHLLCIFLTNNEIRIIMSQSIFLSFLFFSGNLSMSQRTLTKPKETAQASSWSDIFADLILGWLQFYSTCLGFVCTIAFNIIRSY